MSLNCIYANNSLLWYCGHFVNCFLSYVTKAAVQLYYTFIYCLYTTTIAVHVFYSDSDYYLSVWLHIVYYCLSTAKYYTYYFWALNLHIIISWLMFTQVTLPVTMLASSAFLQLLHGDKRLTLYDRSTHTSSYMPYNLIRILATCNSTLKYKKDT
jgi:hypothetical protein